MSKKNFVQKKFWFKNFFLIKNSFGQKKFVQKNFWSKKLLVKNFFCPKRFFRPKKIFGSKTFLVFGPKKTFGSKIFFWFEEKKCLVQNFFCLIKYFNKFFFFFFQKNLSKKMSKTFPPKNIFCAKIILGWKIFGLKKMLACKFLAAMSSSRSDGVTQSVRLFVTFFFF